MDQSNLYGQKDLAEFCEFVIGSLFSVTPSSVAATSAASSSAATSSIPAHGTEGVDTPPYTPPLKGASSSRRSEPPALVEFIAYALYRTRLPISIVHQSLLLLSRLKQRYPSARGTASSPHRLFLSALMLSAKISMDDTYSNKSWAIVGSNYFALKEVNQMERELFAFLGWNVVVAKEELDEFVACAQHSWEQMHAARLAEMHKKRKIVQEAAVAAARENRHQQARHAARALLRPHTYRHSSPSPARSLTSSSRASSAAASPYHSGVSSPHHGFGRMHIVGEPAASSSSSSATSSAMPSASHSPISPASEALSTGPQTPETDHMEVGPAQHPGSASKHAFDESPDFPEAATYVHAKSSRPRSLSPSQLRRLANSQMAS